METETAKTDNRQPAPPLIGREAELRQLHGGLEKALRGERQILFVTGEPGIGKTALTNAFLAQIGTQPDLWIARGQCVEQYGAGEAYLPVLEALGRLGRGAGKEEIVATLAQYAPTWLAQLPALVGPSEREGLQRVLLGATRERMLRELAEALEVLTTKRPFVLALEDLHWGDHSTLELIAYLAQRQGAARLLLIGTYRPAEVLASGHPLRGVVQELQARKQAEELRLSLLSQDGVATYLRGRLGSGARQEVLLQDLATTVYRWTSGNPLFMVSVVEHLLREGTIVEAEGRWQIRGDMAAPRMDVPDSLRRLIEKQYEGLRAEEQHVLEAGSVAGAEFAAAAVAAALGQEIEAVEGWCEGLARKGQFVRASGVEEWPDGTIGGRYSFLHALYQHVVYDRVAAARRLRFHRRIGERKATAYGPQAGEIAGELAAHFESGRDIGKAVRALGQAGENAIGRHAHQEAIRHLTRGLELLPSLPDTPERAQRELTLRVALATPLMAIKGYAAPEVEQTYARAYALCAEVEHTSSATRGSEGSERAPARTVTGRDGGRTSHSLFSVLRGLVSFHHVRAELRAGRAVGERLLRFTEGVEDPLPLVQAHYGQGAILFDLAELAPALSHLERALALYHTQQHEAHVSLYGGYDPGVACLHWSAMTLWFLGYPDQAQRRSDEALRLAQELAHPFSLAWAWHIAAVVHQYRGERQAARECVNVALALAREHGLAFVSALAMLLHGWGLVGQGQAEEGIAGMRAGLSAYQATGAALTLPGYLAMLAAAHARVGQIPEALCLVDEALTVLNRTEERLHEVDLYRLKGEFILRSTVPNPCVEAEAYMRRALEIARRQGAKSLELRAAMSLGRLWQKQGRAEEARRLLEEVYGWFTEGFETRDLRDAEKFLAALGSTIARPADKKIAEPSGAVRTLGASAGVTPPHLWVPGHETAAPPASQPQLSSGPLPASEQVFRKEGEYWTLVFQGDVCRIRDIRGLQYLAHLLRYPQQEVHVLTLVTGGVEPSDAISLAPSAGERRYPQEDAALGFTDAGDVLDTQARAAYKQRLRELHAELEEARGYNDLGRAEKVREEIDFLTQELSLAVGLGGRARKAASVTERARVNVTRALKAAIKKIADAHPSLGQHLARTVKTGTFCSYTPDLPCSWQF